ncbi:hypothetical protein [Prevotella veroralis]|jgi:putative membrane protein|uniref:DUF4386 domain-containing protein n=1 Tax=Prevotella veroralis F0319 TaxID=649761 RepID=C9MSD9_9BACT|nr:hypothetical protein [Prevotella veroralis]EEX17594.1 hypothetical protein HMPREF0973_02558 [Prevotella veroralis F0319]QUB42135.1 hypothetical protein J5A55_09680 [Prevotella veroralis]
MKRFKISAVQSETLNWSIGLFIAFSLVNIVDHWTGAPTEGSTSLTETFATVQSSSAIQIAESILVCATQLVMWEVFRRCLNNSKHFILQLALLVIMVLSVLGTAAVCYKALLPAHDLMMETPREEALIQTFRGYNNVVIGLLNLFLGIGLIRKFRGSIRLYGMSLIICPILIFLTGGVFYYMYNEVGGLSMTAIDTYGTILTLIVFVLGLIPAIALRGSMSSDIPDEEVIG